MAKKKKGKVVSLTPPQLSAEKYIKTQARRLPIAECLLSKDWETAGMCNVLIARKHVTGNITLGMYLVDMFCLGLKNTIYEFNLSPNEYADMKAEADDWEPCEYTLAHNIIYGAIDYAEDYGFKPHADFAVSEFILEEDDDQIELIELDFGLDGKPTFVYGSEDSPQSVKNILATLNRTAGPGNFRAVDIENEDLDFEGDEYDDEDDFDDDLPVDPNKFLNAIEGINKTYDELVRTNEAKEILEKSTIGAAYTLSEDKADNESDRIDDPEIKNEYDYLYKLAFENEDYDEAVDAITAGIAKYPDQPLFYSLLAAAYAHHDEFEKAYEQTTKSYHRFPNHLFSMTGYANVLLGSGKPDELMAVFKDKHDLDLIYPDRKVYQVHEASTFYGIMCKYFLYVDDIDSADLYMNAIYRHKLNERGNQHIIKPIMIDLCRAKIHAIAEANGIDLSGKGADLF